MPQFTFCPSCTSELSLNENNYLACISEDCTFIHYNNPTPVLGAIIEYGENHLLLGHNKLWPKSWYALITGFLEENEHPQECILREIKEEVGLDATIVSFIGHYTFKKMNQLIIVYHVTAQGEIILDDEIDDVKIIPFEKVRTWPSGTGEALRVFLKSRGFDPEVVDIGN